MAFLEEYNDKFENLRREYKERRIALFQEEMAAEWALVKSKGDEEIRKHYSLERIARLNEEGGSHFFASNTMRFFGDKRANYTVHVLATDDANQWGIYVERLQAPRYAPKDAEFTRLYRFDPCTGELYGLENRGVVKKSQATQKSTQQKL